MAYSQPYTKQVTVVVPASGQNDATYQVSSGLFFHLKHWMWTFTSNLFSLVDIRVNNSLHFLDASVSTPVPGASLYTPGNGNFNWRDFDLALDVPSNATLFISCKDNSGAQNTISITLTGIMDFPGSAPAAIT